MSVENLRVLQVHNQHQGRGGADAVLDHEAELLTESGHVVERFLQPPADRAAGHRVADGVKAVWNVPAARAVGDLIARFRPDVMHVHTPFPLLSPAVFRVAARHGVPAVTTSHSFRYSCIAATCLRAGEICEACVGQRLKLPGIRHRCYHDSLAASTALTASLATHRMLGTFRRHVRRFITLTEFARQLLIRDGAEPDQVVVKPNSIADPGPPRSRTGTASYAAFIGRFVEEKGIRTLLRAWDRIGGRLPLRIAGDGPLRGEVEAATATNPAITYVGWLDERALDEFVAGAEFVVVPSEWYEAGEPLVLLRALALGRPVVVCDLDNICATVRRERAGLTFRPADADALADSVETGLRDLEELRAMGVRGRAAYDAHFTPERNRDRLLEIYGSVVVPKNQVPSRSRSR